MSVAYKLIESFVKVRPLLCGKPTEDGIAAKRCFRVIIFILVTFRLGLIFFNDRMAKREENNDFISSFRGDDRFVVVRPRQHCYSGSRDSKCVTLFHSHRCQTKSFVERFLKYARARILLPLSIWGERKNPNRFHKRTRTNAGK